MVTLQYTFAPSLNDVKNAQWFRLTEESRVKNVKALNRLVLEVCTRTVKNERKSDKKNEG
jgi:hypothetical protein